MTTASGAAFTEASGDGVSRAPATRSVLAIVWDDFPLLNYAFYAVTIAHAEIANLQVARLDLLPTGVFPMIVPWLIYGLRARNASWRERGVGIGVCVGAPLLIAASYFTGARAPLTVDVMRDIYETAAIVNTVILLLHAARRGRHWIAFYLGPAALYGLLLENGGIYLGFFRELNYHLYLGPLPAPVATMAGWVTIFYLVTWVAWEIRRHIRAMRSSAFGSALVAMLAGLALDLQIDPIATHIGLWHWNTALTEGWYGVPILNFVAWSCAIFPFAWMMFLREGAFGLARGEITETVHRAWAWGKVLPVLAVASVLFLVVMAIFEGGFDGPTYVILRLAAARLGLLGPDQVWQPGF